MSAVWVFGAMWMASSLGVALLLAGAIRRADAGATVSPTEQNFAVDGDPFAVPPPAAPGRLLAG